jgi:hypothetical protein
MNINQIIKKNYLVNLLGTSSLLFVILLWNYNILLTVVLLLVGIIMLKLINSKDQVITFIFCGFFGATAETLAIYFGVWNYSNSSFFGIPIWLAPLWGIAAIFMSNLNKQIKELNLFK